ncbi:S-adenosylmethionine decarboxylase proenzyme [bacterium]|nr:S-adenosylmethionine decarboxylase proenzyme [bacterium]
MKALGRQVLVEFFDCDSQILNDVDAIKMFMQEATAISQAHIVQSVFHLFNPHGVSGVVVIAESHFAIHTWPEYGYAAVDLFTCGEQVDPWKAMEYLKKCLKSSKAKTIEMKRGQLDTQGKELYYKPPVIDFAPNPVLFDVAGCKK